MIQQNNTSEKKDMFPDNCPVMEETADGVPIGRCWFHMKDGICPRHGKQTSEREGEIEKGTHVKLSDGREAIYLGFLEDKSDWGAGHWCHTFWLEQSQSIFRDSEAKFRPLTLTP